MRIYKRDKVWYVDYTYKGSRTRRKVGHSKKIAELALNDIELKITKDVHLGIHEPDKVLFEEVAISYLRFSKANKSINSYNRDTISLKKHLIPYFNGDYLISITPQAIEEYKIKRLEKVSPATVNRELACLKHLISKSIEWGYCNDNPAKKVRLLKEPPGRIRYLEDYEIQMLLDECSPELKPIVIVALNTGMRKSEILNLKWNDISFKDNIIIVRNSKNNESRVIPMNSTVKETLKRRYHPENDYVFSNKKGDPYKQIKTGFKSALKRAGIEDFRFHDIRHTFASHLVMAGCGIKTVQQLLGHKDLRMTMRYSHLSKTHLQNAVNLLDRKSSKNGTNMAQMDLVKNGVTGNP